MFGASGITDAYLIAMIIPSLFIGTISTAFAGPFITVYGSYIAKGENDKAWQMCNTIISFFIIFFSILFIILFVFTSSFVHLVAPTYSGEIMILTVNLTRMLLPTVIFSSLLSILIGINNANHSFIAPASNGLISNILIILSIYSLGILWGVYGLVAGVTLGVLAQFLLQSLSARKCGLRYKFNMDLRDQGIRQVLTLIPPFVFSAAIAQINLLVDRTLATRLPAGAVSALYFSNKLVSLPNSILAGAVAMVALPTLIKAASTSNWVSLVEAMVKAIRLILFVILPAAMGIYVLRVPLVQILFQHGAFTINDTHLTASTVSYMLGTLVFGSIVSLMGNVYLATRKVLPAVIMATFALVVNILLSLILVQYMQQRGLALANTISAFVNLILQFSGLFSVLKLHEKTDIPIKAFSLFVIKVIVSSVTMGIVVYLVNNYLEFTIIGKSIISKVCISIVLGVLSYLFMTLVFKLKEADDVVGLVLNRIKIFVTTKVMRKTRRNDS